MSKQTPSNLFMLSPFGSKQAGFYQDLLRGVLSYPQLGNRLIHLAEQAHIFRQFDRVKECGQILTNFPLKPYPAIGYYFLGVAANSRGSGDQDEAKRLFELVADIAPDAYKLKSILSLGSLAFRRKDFDFAIRSYKEAVRAGSLSVASLQAIKAIGVVKAMAGDHQQALEDLESLLPVIKHAPAHIYFDLLNSYAVELGEVGRKNEARNVIRHVLASPLIDAYPEWRETAEDLRPARRSFVAPSSTYYNILALPERKPSAEPPARPEPARVFNFAKLKQKIVKEKQDRNLAAQLDHMNPHDLGFTLLEIITQHRPTHRQLRAIIEFALNLFSYPTNPGDPDEPDKPSA